MTFAHLLPGAAVFVDANTLVYYFQPHPVYGPACQQFVQRVEQQLLLGTTSTHVLGEMAHRLLAQEAVAVGGWSGGKVIQRLKQQPSVIQNSADSRRRWTKYCNHDSRYCQFLLACCPRPRN